MKRLLAPIYSLSFVLFTGLSSALAAFAEPGAGNPVSQVQVNAVANVYVGRIWDRALSIAFATFSWLAIIVLIWSGIQYISAGGDTTKAKNARNRMTGAVVGIIVFTASYAIVDLLSGSASQLAGWLH